MPKVKDIYHAPRELLLGKDINSRVPPEDQKRQRAEVEEILRRLGRQPGVILADEVGMGKTFVALATAYCVSQSTPRGPVIVMVPANLVDKWSDDLKSFCDLYLENRHALTKDSPRKDFLGSNTLRYGIARHSVELMKLLDDPLRERCQLIFLSQGAMSRGQTDKWVRLAMIADCLRLHARGKADRLIKVKKNLHRFLGELLSALGEERAHQWGFELWDHLLRTDSMAWKDIYNQAVSDERRKLTDDPVPKSVKRALSRINLSPLSEALKKMPIYASGGEERVSERILEARHILRGIEEEMWKELLAKAEWHSPLLIMDEAHHLKNPQTALARQLQSPDVNNDLKTGDGAMANSFDRMLFLTATPFQLGHHELVSVLERFGDVRWDEDALGSREDFKARLLNLRDKLNESQRTAIGLQRSWSRLRSEDCEGNADQWWERLVLAPRDTINTRQRAVLDGFQKAKSRRDEAQTALEEWVVRHNKGTLWANTEIVRRLRIEGAGISGIDSSGGLAVPPGQLLPFFLAARSAVDAGKDLLGEALCSSYEAFRKTKNDGNPEKDALDSEDGESPAEQDGTQARWYLKEFDKALECGCAGIHPKVEATVKRTVDLWESGEKVLIFAFYRKTCRSLRIHVSREIERRMEALAKSRLAAAGQPSETEDVDRIVDAVQNRFFDKEELPGRRALDRALESILSVNADALETAGIDASQKAQLVEIMRRFLRVQTTLVRCFPIGRLDTLPPEEAVENTLDSEDRSGVSWRQKFNHFVEFIAKTCSGDEISRYLDAATRTQTGGIRVERGQEEDLTEDESLVVLANVQEATGVTKRDARSRLMRAFNTPFFPDILVCSQVMGEGVDLQRFCRHVVHHDLAWNPSTIEQRTGRIDRLGCKAEGRQPVVMFLPFLAGTADERQFKVMSDREQWFKVVMGQDEVGKLITPDKNQAVPLPACVAEELSFKLGLQVRAKSSTGP